VTHARSLLRPRWLLSHLLVLGLVVLMVNLGFWQLRRLDERRDFNAVVRARQEEPVVPVADAAQASAEYRRVTATGRYDAAHEVIVRGRSANGHPGVWVMTPLATDEGDGVLVNRGFLRSRGVPEAVPAEAAAPSGVVTVTGMLRPSGEGPLRATDPEPGEVPTLGRPDVAWVDDRVAYDLLPSWLALEEQEPTQPDGVPVPIDEPELSEGPHLSYAVQWFVFSAIALVGYPLILRRQLRS
jgi:cytochrome oxidase assembly protein ShyY1